MKLILILPIVSLFYMFILIENKMFVNVKFPYCLNTIRNTLSAYIKWLDAINVDFIPKLYSLLFKIRLKFYWKK